MANTKILLHYHTILRNIEISKRTCQDSIFNNLETFDSGVHSLSQITMPCNTEHNSETYSTVNCKVSKMSKFKPKVNHIV